MDNIRDLAIGIVATAPSPADSGLTLTLETGQGGDMPPVPFKALAYPPGEMPTKYNAERILVTARTDDEITFSRAQGETSAQEIATGWLISNNIFADDFELLIATLKAEENPIGTVYINADDDTNPEILLNMPGTTWIPWAVGRHITGHDPNDTDFDTPGETGGAKTHTLTIAEMPAHTHNSGGSSWGDGSTRMRSGADGGDFPQTSSTGGGGAHNNLGPYQVGYVWKRTA